MSHKPRSDARTRQDSPDGDVWPDVALTQAIADVIKLYATDVHREFERLRQLAIWDCGRARWRGARNPRAYLKTMIRNVALRTLQEERPMNLAPLSDAGSLADEGQVPRADGLLGELDQDMRTVIEARIRGVAWSEIGFYAGIDSKRVEAARGRIRRLRHRETRPAGAAKLFKQRLNNSGRWCFSFQESDFGVLESLLAVERENIFAVPRPKSIPAPLITCRDTFPMPTEQIDLRKKFRDASKRLIELNDEHTNSQELVRKLEAAVTEAKDAARVDRERALIERRKQNDKLAAAVQPLEDELRKAEDDLGAIDGAIHQLKEERENIQAEIATNLQQEFERVIEPIVLALFGHVASGAEMMAQIQNHARDFGQDPTALALAILRVLLRGVAVGSTSDQVFLNICTQLLVFYQFRWQWLNRFRTEAA